MSDKDYLAYINNPHHGQDTDMLKRISLVAWQNINLYGRYEFNTSQESINMDEIIQVLTQSKYDIW